MEQKLQKTILVTGGAGFIGSHLCEKLLELGSRVICFDNLLTGKMENISHLQKEPNFVFIKGDANSYIKLNEVFSQENIDYVFHYAAVLGVQRVTENPLLVLPDITGVENILKLAKEHRVKKVVYASSSEAYGYTEELPLKENNGKDIVNQGIHSHLYALVKLMGEKMMKVYNDLHGLPTTSLRFFNVFGPRQESSSYGFVTGVFIKQIINNQPPTIFGDGQQTRDFIYIDDNIRLAINALLTPATDGEVINIGAGRQITILNLAERLIKISGKNLTPQFVPGRKYEIKYRNPDITKMNNLLNERIEDNLDANLKKTYDWYLQNNDQQTMTEKQETISNKGKMQSGMIYPEFFPITKGDTVLNAGCGDCVQAVIYGGNFKKMVGIDINPKRLERAKQIAKDISNLEMLEANIENIPLEEKFDKVIAIDSIEHVINPNKAANEFYRLLKDDGKLLITFPAMHDKWENLFRFIGRKILRKKNNNIPRKGWDPDMHQYNYKLNYWINIIEKAGFRLEDSMASTLFPPLHYLGLPKFWFSNKLIHSIDNRLCKLPIIKNYGQALVCIFKKVTTEKINESA